jgi:hypothetical protein
MPERQPERNVTSCFVNRYDTELGRRNNEHANEDKGQENETLHEEDLILPSASKRGSPTSR